MAKIADQFKGLPMGELIANPLMAAAQAQGKLAGVTEKFIKEVGLESGNNGELSARTVDFKYDSPVQDENGNTNIESRNLKVPLLAIVGTPNLSVKNVTVDFDMTVKSSTSNENTTKADVKTKVSYDNWWSPVKAEMTASVSNKSTNTRKTDNSARYTVHCEARDDGAPEGLMKVLDILNSDIQPVPVGASKQNKTPKKNDD